MAYLDLLAERGIDGAHPGGFALTRALLGREMIDSNTVVLDVGCGTGQTSSYIAKKYKCSVVAIDNNAKMLEKAQQRFQKDNLKIRLVRADAMCLPFWPNSFDIVLAESVTIFTNIIRTLREYFRVLKPSGTLIDVEMTAEMPLTVEEWKDVKSVYGIKQVPTQDEWTCMLKAAGFSNIQIFKGRMNPLELLFGNRLGEEFSAHFNLMKQYYRKLGYRVYRCN